MSDYSTTKARILQYVGIILVMAVFAGAYWYFQVFAGYKTSTGQTGILTSGLVGIWSFDGADVSGSTATDRSGSSNTGTISGATVTQGKVGQALSFDGVNDSVNAGNNASLQLTTGTVSAWIKTTGAGSGYRAIIVKGNAYGLFLVDNVLTVYDWGASAARSTGLNLSDGNWHFVTQVFQSSVASGTTVYVDGVLALTTTITVSSQGVQLGIGDSVGSSQFFAGTIDEPRVYNRVLTASEIQSLYKLGQSDEVNTGASQARGTGRLDSGLSGYWKMDDGSGTSVADSSTNGNAMTLANSPTWDTGQINGAVTFGGGSDYGTATMGDIIVGSKVTTAFWYSANVSNGSTQNFYHRGSGGCAQYLSLVTGGASTDTLSFYYRDTSCGGIDNYQVSGISKNTWHHIVSTYDTVSGVLIVYVDGVQQGTTTAIPGSSIATSGTLTFADNQGGGNNYSGSLDEFRIYNRTLSTDEVSQLYRLTTPTGVDTGLKGYWSFNGKDISGTSAYDQSGVGTIGTLTNGPVVTPGTIGQALNFDGVDDYVQLASNTALDVSDNFTLSAWVRPESFATLAGIVGKYHAISGDYFLRFNGASPYNKIEFGGSTSITSNSTLATGQWYHIVAERSSGTGYIYINGVLDTSGSVSIGSSASNDVTIGLDYLPSPRYFKGKIDEVRIYNRVLSGGEIKSLYASGQSDEVNTGASQAQGTGRLDSGLAGYWKLDDGSGTSATDASTNGNTGTLTNGPTWGTGQIGGDVVFDGSNDYISYANNIAFDSADFTIASWFRLSADAGGADGDATFFSQRTDVANDAEPAVVFYVRNSNDKLNAVIRDNTGAAIVSTGATTISQSQWYHGTMVKTSTRLTLYLNGVQDASTSHTLSGDFDAGATHRYIGKNRYSGADNGLLNGALDEVRVYNRALSADEIAQLYRLTTPTGTDTGLKGYWSFNGKDLSGATAYDRSGSGNNGTLTNGPTVAPGKVGQALEFDGANDYVSISDTDDSKYTGSLTLCTWAKIDTGGAYRHFMGKHSSSGATQNPFDFRTDNAATPKLTLVRANSTNIGWEGPTVTLGQWKHYCVVAPALIQSAPTFYVDGVATTGSIASGSGTGAATGSGAPIVIGLRPDNAVIMDGAMDEVRIYNRELTSNEIMALYNSGR